MSDRTYWLCLFNHTTWQEFLDAGGAVMGFPETRQNTVRQIKPGDYLLAYMTGVSRWIAVLEVMDEPYDDLTHIWKQALFPCRVKVQVITSVDIESGIPALSLSKNLKMFDNMKTPNWGLLFRTAPKKLISEDGEAIVKAVEDAAA
ncbi:MULTISPECIES: EVE domain-containing protein [Cyanophyceae]|uniref:EVE domain-containing protein n=1 Tax=Leptolyngbya subtilissima DQ-A4 TaxID=2933933 RepID=A0ABV0KBH8_9CYAN|nr:EVE domain-containing protein [Nodosilinea sp. FACHB-141]MBD2114931.1 EVE domain-containing protein [Nodosilinea sp. FACHB-141]